MKIKHSTQTLILLSLLLLILAACSPVDITGKARDQVLAYSEPMADNLLNAITASDYALFTRDMDDAMLKAFTQAEFTNLHDQLNGKIGQYVSRQVTNVAPSQEMMVVTYSARYTQEDGVTVRIVFGGTPTKITGLWFDSAKLRQK
jgi:hypothetical protein